MSKKNTSSISTSSSPFPLEGPAGYLARELAEWQAAFAAQPPLVQRFLEAQARSVAEALLQATPYVRFTLPDQVTLKASTSYEKPSTVPIPPEQREQMAGGLLERLTRADLNGVLSQRLAELENSPNLGVAASAGLIRYTTAVYMVYHMLPSGRMVKYRAMEGEEIPSVPEEGELEPASAITAPTDAIVEETPKGDEAEAGRGELLAPYVPAARRFYLPQWVAFDDQDRLLVNSIAEAEAHVGSMQRFLAVIHAAVALAPYLVADDVYQGKRYGMLGQLVNQGRALARYQTREIIQTIRQRAAAHELNRGLSLSLPYFDDQDLQIKTHNFEIIPAGRIMFVPGFVVRAARQEYVKVAQDTRLSPSTRHHLLAELHLLEQAFETSTE